MNMRLLLCTLTMLLESPAYTIKFYSHSLKMKFQMNKAMRFTYLKKIKNLGGEPATKPASVKQANTIQERLEASRKVEFETIQRHEVRKQQADNLGLTELTITLEDMIADETGHLDEIDRLLKDPLFF